jgi:hypothetical protein
MSCFSLKERTEVKGDDDHTKHEKEVTEKEWKGN